MSLRKAINDMCRRCSYDALDVGTWRAQVEACSADDCPLWPYRPRRTKKSEDSAELAENPAEDSEVEA